MFSVGQKYKCIRKLSDGRLYGQIIKIESIDSTTINCVVVDVGNMSGLISVGLMFYFEQSSLEEVIRDNRWELINDNSFSDSNIQSNNNDGMFCSGCQNYFPMAVANQSNGTLKCFTCRKYRSYE